MLTIGSLFSGIGGLEMGLEWAGLGPVRWQVERDEFCRRVLAKHWPDVKRYDDVCTIGAALERVDLICGGFPCQDVSSAGKRAGLAGSRSGLWREFARIVGIIRPRWVVVENVASGATRWVDAVVRDLAEFGYASLPIPLSASDVGAPHKRERVFVVAYCRDNGRAQLGKTDDCRSSRQHDEARRESHRRCAPMGFPPGPLGWSEQTETDDQPFVRRVADGLPARLDLFRALGNCVVPQCAEVIGHIVRELAQ